MIRALTSSLEGVIRSLVMSEIEWLSQAEDNEVPVELWVFGSISNYCCHACSFAGIFCL